MIAVGEIGEASSAGIGLIFDQDIAFGLSEDWPTVAVVDSSCFGVLQRVLLAQGVRE